MNIDEQTLNRLIDSIKKFDKDAETEYLKYYHEDKMIISKDKDYVVTVSVCLMDKDSQKQMMERLDDLHRILCMKPWETREDVLLFIGKPIRCKESLDVSSISGAMMYCDKLVIQTGMGDLYADCLFRDYEFVNQTYPVLIPNRYDHNVIGKNI